MDPPHPNNITNMLKTTRDKGYIYKGQWVKFRLPIPAWSPNQFHVWFFFIAYFFWFNIKSWYLNYAFSVQIVSHNILIPQRPLLLYKIVFLEKNIRTLFMHVMYIYIYTCISLICSKHVFVKEKPQSLPIPYDSCLSYHWEIVSWFQER